MNNTKDANLPEMLCYLVGTIMILAGCSSPFDRKMRLLDLQNPNPTVRIMAVKQAGDSKSMAAVPQLVNLLQDEDRSVRFYSIEALRRITGTDNGFDYKADAEHQAQAVARWREYLKLKGLQNYEN